MGGKEMKTNMNNKLLKVTLLVAIFATTQVPALLAQSSSTPTDSEVAFVYGSGATMEIGDSVMIHQDSLRYLTGERMSSWVYGVPHQIRQLGTKTKPTGVLLRGIYSWIAQGSLIPLNAHKTQEYIDAQRAAAEAAAAAEEAARLAAEEAARLAAEAALMEAVYVEEDTVVEVKDTVVPDLPFEVNRFSVGVRGGLASLMPQTTPAIGATWGFDALLDLQYAHYWAKGNEKIRLGLLTGLSIGYMQNSKTLKNVNEQYTKHSEGDIDYTIHMDEVSATNRQLQLEVPVMFSMVAPKGLFLNVGPKFILPVHASYKQTLKNGDINAYLVDMGVNVKENVVTGEIKEAEFVHDGVNDQQFDLTIAVGGELGYEHQLQSGHSVSVGLYANYGVFSTYKHNPDAKYIVDVTPPTAEGLFQLTPNSMTNAYANKMGYLDLGLKLTFHLNWKK